MLDLTKEEKIVVVFILTAFLIGSTVSHYKKRPNGLPVVELALKDRGEAIHEDININTADIIGLIKIKGVGIKTAERIIDYRQVNGSFFSKEDIMKIKGVGPNKFEALKDRISVR